MVLAQGIEGDLLDDDHLAVGDVEDSVVDEPFGIDVVAGRQLDVHPMDPLRRAEQALPRGILADLVEDLTNRGFDPAILAVLAVVTVEAATVDVVRPARIAADLVRSNVRLADLGLDLVDEATNVRRELVGLGHPADGTRGNPIAVS